MTTGAYDPVEDMLKVKSVQKKWRDSFTGAELNPGKWTNQIGSGATISVGSGLLTMASGATADAETWVLSTETFTVPFRLSIGLTLSQRLANQSFWVEAVSVNRETGVPDGLHALSLLFDGTTATLAKYEVQNGGLARLTSAGSTFPTTASGGVYEIEPFADEAWFHGGTLDATTGRANSYRRHQQIPDPNALYKVRLRWLNAATPPASSTNAVVQYIAVQDYAELTAEITAGRGQSVAGQSVAVGVVSMPAVSTVGGQARNTTGALPVLVATGASANPVAVTTGRGVDLLATLVGALVTKPFSLPELDWSYAGPITGLTTATDTAVRAAAGVGIRSYVTGLQVQNTSATASEFQIKDGATVLWRCLMPANSAFLDITFPSPLRGTANTALNIQAVTAGSVVVANLQGYAAP
ncbi:ubiquitin-activating E1 FCCH domain-containing protein [Sediminicoccus sp. BL-A-41-H5]|uniref:ubiquitin-activating E1 FCCH domain-containing protein n=1 Tax=Sediminicoccus sp. BL-A-41-H5 TaxID=3421106 RepID=UPI003D6667A4